MWYIAHQFQDSTVYEDLHLQPLTNMPGEVETILNVSYLSTRKRWMNASNNDTFQRVSSKPACLLLFGELEWESLILSILDTLPTTLSMTFGNTTYTTTRISGRFYAYHLFQVCPLILLWFPLHSWYRLHLGRQRHRDCVELECW